MAKIYYKEIKLPYLAEAAPLMISRICRQDTDEVILSASPAEYTHVFVNEKRYVLKDGAVKINAEEIPDGISEITFIAKTKKITASPIFKSGGAVGRAPIDTGSTAAIEETLVRLSEKLSEAEGRILALEESVKPKNMFNFT